MQRLRCGAGRSLLWAGWALRGTRGNPPERGHADLEVLRADRHARADLAPPPGPDPDRIPCQGTVAATGPGQGPQGGPGARPGPPGVGSPQGLGMISYAVFCFKKK